VKGYLKRWHRVVVVIGVVVGLLAGTVLPAWAGNPNPGVIPPQAKAHGMTYGEWSAKWWQWAYSLPVDQNPFFDENGSCANGANGQSGPVWFLTGVINQSGTAVRNCTIPAGKTLFFPILNVEAATLEGNGSNLDELRAALKTYMDVVIVSSVAADIDGTPVQDVPAYRAESPLFTYGPLPENNVLAYFGWDAPAGATSLSAADGYYLMLAPLPVGKHVIHFTGTFGDPFNFTLDITYNLIVVP
jgi:hypothetical protein